MTSTTVAADQVASQQGRAIVLPDLRTEAFSSPTADAAPEITPPFSLVPPTPPSAAPLTPAQEGQFGEQQAASASEVVEAPENTPANPAVETLLAEAVAKQHLTQATSTLLSFKLTSGDEPEGGRHGPLGKITEEQVRWVVAEAERLFNSGLEDVGQRIFELLVDNGFGVANVEKHIRDGTISSTDFFTTVQPQAWMGFATRIPELAEALSETWSQKRAREQAQLQAANAASLVSSPSLTPTISGGAPQGDFLNKILAEPTRKEFIFWENRPTVLIVPGHGGGDPGAVASSGLREEEIAREQSLYVAEYLLSKQINVVILRRTASDDYSIGQRNAEIQKRDGAGNLVYDAALSVHFNAGPSAATGIEVFYADSSDKALAEAIDGAWGNVGNMRNRGVKSHTLTGVGSLGIMRNNPVAVALTEGGFMSNASDLAKLSDPNFLREQGHAIGRGIEAYLSSVV